MKKYNLITENYKKYRLFAYSEKNISLLKAVIDKNYSVEREYKNDKRTYVAKIFLEKEIYIIKKPYNNKILKNFLTLLKKCESITIFFNTNKAKKEGLNEIVTVLGTGIYKKYGIIKEEFYVMEYLEGEIIINFKSLEKILKIVQKVHKIGRYHGDCNPYNFLFNKDQLYILDTKLKKMQLGNFRAHYDILTLQKYFTTGIKYPYKKNIFYYIAYIMKKIRNLKKK